MWWLRSLHGWNPLSEETLFLTTSCFIHTYLHHLSGPILRTTQPSLLCMAPAVYLSCAVCHHAGDLLNSCSLEVSLLFCSPCPQAKRPWPIHEDYGWLISMWHTARSDTHLHHTPDSQGVQLGYLWVLFLTSSVPLLTGFLQRLSQFVHHK